MKLITRSEWGARRPNCGSSLPWSSVSEIYIHYTASDADEQADHANCARRVKGIQDFHMGSSRGWCDIAYSFVFCKHGVAFEGRGYGNRTAANGTNEANSRGYAFVFLGDDNKTRDDVTAAGRRVLGEMIRDAIAKKGAPLRVRPHSDAVGTDCPGDELRAYIATKGWEIEKRPGRPKWFFRWLAWKLGEGPFKKYGPENPRVRPSGVPKKIPPHVWVFWRQFMAARKKKEAI